MHILQELKFWLLYSKYFYNTKTCYISYKLCCMYSYNALAWDVELFKWLYLMVILVNNGGSSTVGSIERYGMSPNNSRDTLLRSASSSRCRNTNVERRSHITLMQLYGWYYGCSRLLYWGWLLWWHRWSRTLLRLWWNLWLLWLDCWRRWRGLGTKLLEAQCLARWNSYKCWPWWGLYLLQLHGTLWCDQTKNLQTCRNLKVHFTKYIIDTTLTSYL
jgi:hypothetical protein